jgi:carboxymethylenebutenolidase
MKYLFLIALVFTFIPIVSRAQHSCCTPNAKFTAFAAEDNFIRSHDTPLPYKGEDHAGKMISFATQSGGDASAYLIKSDRHPNKVILMFHEFWGLNDYIKSEADKLSKALDVTVFAVDLYDGKVGTTREEAVKYMQSLTPERGNAIIDGAISYFGKEVRFGTIGWCMGGTWSMQAALRAGDQCDACVIYYGMPETDQAKLKNLHAPVMMVNGEKDKWITPKVVADFKDAMKAAGKHISVHSYNADHAFANPSNPNHDKEDAEDAYNHEIDFFKRKMKLF